MKTNLLFGLLILTQTLFAQTFTVAPSTQIFDGVWLSSIAFTDVDGDTDQDLFITGQNSSDELIAKLYLNDGLGNYTEKTGTPFDVIQYGSIAFSDVDGDTDQDLLITGWNGYPIAKLYVNDGLGNYTEKPGNPFDGVRYGSIAFADVDRDNDQDLLITGQNSSGERISKLYLNDGLGNYTEKTGTPFDGVRASSIAFADVDGDNDQDLFISGWPNQFHPISKLFLNDGFGNYTEKTGTPFGGIAGYSIAFTDVDGDTDQDLLIMGQQVGQEIYPILKLYRNDGLGNFTQSSPSSNVSGGSFAFLDVDGDTDQDLLIMGQNYFHQRISKLYLNDGLGNFTEKPDNPFPSLVGGSIAVSDVDGDNDQDLLITGQDSSLEPITILYTNDGMASSTYDLIPGINLVVTPYPNPAKSTLLQVNFDSAENGFATLKVFDLNGHLLSQQKAFTAIGQQTVSIDIAALAPGIYFIELDNGKRKGVARFIVQ